MSYFLQHICYIVTNSGMLISYYVSNKTIDLDHEYTRCSLKYYWLTPVIYSLVLRCCCCPFSICIQFSTRKLKSGSLPLLYSILSKATTTTTTTKYGGGEDKLVVHVWYDCPTNVSHQIHECFITYIKPFGEAILIHLVWLVKPRWLPFLFQECKKSLTQLGASNLYRPSIKVWASRGNSTCCIGNL